MIGNKYDFVLFDLDGTLLDTSEGILSAVRHTIKAYGLKQLDQEALLKFIGPPIQDSFRSAYSLEGDILQEVAATFRNRYKEADLLKAKPYPKIYEVFKSLSDKGVKSAIATYKRQDYAEQIIKHFGFDEYVDIIYGADFDGKLKKADIIRNCLIDLGAHHCDHAVMIGDSLLDADGAKINGIDFIGVTYGFDFKSKDDVENCYSVGCAESSIELLKFFNVEKEEV